MQATKEITLMRDEASWKLGKPWNVDWTGLLGMEHNQASGSICGFKANQSHSSSPAYRFLHKQQAGQWQIFSPKTNNGMYLS